LEKLTRLGGRVMEELIYKFVTSDDELRGAFAVRRKVFIEEQDISEEIELDEFDDTVLHMVVQDGERIVATARVRFPSEDTVKIERMAVLPPYRRRGTGRGIISFIIDEMKKKGISLAVLHAQYAVKDFYRSCGFEETGEPFREAGIKHIEMHRRL
jgi:predicted GNAT family N-acyltransferase